MGPWSTSGRRIRAWKVLVRLIDLPSNRVLGRRNRVWCQIVFSFFSQLPTDVGFSVFFFQFSIANITLGSLAFTSTLLSASLARWCLPDVFFCTFRAGGRWPSIPVLVTLTTLEQFPAPCCLNFVTYWCHPVSCVVDVRLFNKVNWPFSYRIHWAQYCIYATCESGGICILKFVLLGLHRLLLFCQILAGWIRRLVPGRPWAHASSFPFRNDAIIYCSSYAVDGHVFLL